MKFKVCDWEDNGYDDSDFYGAYFDSETGTVKTMLIGTTRGAMPTPKEWSDMPLPTAEVVEEARQWLQGHIYGVIHAAEHRDAAEPSLALLGNGVRVKLTKAHRNVAKETEPCRKCSGTGYWVNPRNTEDKRECFNCNGTGEFKTRTRKKDENGKQVYVAIAEGTEGVIVGSATYGTFYRNGYNKPGRHNTTLKVKLDDGTTVNVPAEKVKLATEPLTDAELAERAKKLSFGYQWGAACGCKAWLSKDYTTGLHGNMA
jgi:hypothetical protein